MALWLCLCACYLTLGCTKFQSGADSGGMKTSARILRERESREGRLIEDLEVKTFCNVQDSRLCMSGYSCGCEVSVSVSGITFGFMRED